MDAYALFPAEQAPPPIEVGDAVRVRMPLTGDYQLYVALDGDRAPDVLAELGQRGAETHLGTAFRIGETIAAMPTRIKPPTGDDSLGFGTLSVMPGMSDVVAKAISNVNEVIGVATSETGGVVIVEITGSSAGAVQRSFEQLVSQCGAALNDQKFAVGPLPAAEWRDG